MYEWKSSQSSEQKSNWNHVLSINSLENTNNYGLFLL
jgi:hypothetical protein